MLCRLCLYEANQEESMALFSNGDESNLTKLIAKYMHIEVSETVDLSTRICKECYQHLNDFHIFFQYVEQRQNELQNEFLEVNCVITEGATPAKETANAADLNEEESLLDMKDIISVGETNLDKLLPQAEFGFADDDFADNFDNGNEDDSDRFSNGEKDEDDLPLQTLLPKVLISKKFTIKQEKCDKPQRKSSRVRKMTLRKRKTKVTTRRNKNVSAEDMPDDSAEHFNDDTSKATSLQKRTCNNSHTPEENKLRDEMIAKYMRLKCEICDAEVLTFKELRLHFRKEHNSRAYITCCGTRFHRRFILVDHIQVHLNPEYFKCKVCQKVLKSKICLDIHYANKHAEKSELKHPCTHCDRRFAHLSNLAAHMLSHTDERKHHCAVCNKGFKSNYMLKVHIRAMHEQRTPYICDTCGKEYKFKPSFERHVAEHQGQPNEPTEQCTICGKWLMPNGLRRHMDRHNVQDVECKLCGKILKSKAALIGHIEYSHKKKQIYACTFCEKTFKRPCVLKEHIAMHTGQKDYNCKYCRREFRSKANMYAHIKKTHVEEWAQAQLNRNKGPSGKIENEPDNLTSFVQV